MRKFTLFIASLMLCVSSVWAQNFTRTVDGIVYTANANPVMIAMMPSAGQVAITGVTDMDATEFALVASVSAGQWSMEGGAMSLDVMMSVNVSAIAEGAFIGLNADEVTVTLPIASDLLALNGSYDATFGDNVSVYAPTADLQTAYNAVPAWENKVLFGEEQVIGGECGAEGDNLTWELDAANELLIISGEGEMADYEWINYGVTNVPWMAYINQFKAVELPDGLTRIGNCAFYNTIITELELPQTLTSLGDYAFANTQYLSGQTVEMPAGLEEVGVSAFSESNANLHFLGVNPPVFATEGHLLREAKTITVPDGCLNAYREAIGAEEATRYTYPASCGPTMEWYATHRDTRELPSTPSQLDTLYILGSGVMEDAYVTAYGDVLAPWFVEYNVAGDFIQGPATIYIAEGVTHIGKKSFLESVASSVVICDALTAPTLGEQAFPSGKRTLRIRSNADLASYVANGWETYFNIEVETETAVENVQRDRVQSTKVLENGMLFIERNGIRYTVTGAR